ncbi:Uncharacterized protein ChrSV_3794 [Chromobacterium vaccinii]|nr:Uncharacterized protein ChrSW_3794 [Chromobacterium vaccinii]QND91251.1 Uncharacterized protein ChrSV_3794 [Chromobacterium vaccinii]
MFAIRAAQRSAFVMPRMVLRFGLKKIRLIYESVSKKF